MVSGFRRSLSLPGSNPSDRPARRRCDKPQHLRSISLPCRSHPTLSHLLDQIRSCPESGPRSPASGLDRIDRLLSALDDLLRLPQTQDALRRRPAWADRVLDGFLRLADAHGSFRSAVVAVEQHHAESRAAIRRRDPVRLDSAARSHRRAEKELIRLATAIKDLARSPPLICSDAAEAEVAGIVADVMAAAAATSTAVFLGIAAASSTVAGSCSKSSWTAWPSRRPSKKGSEEAEMAAMEALEERMEGLEEGSGRVFRSLVNIRVSLLNILTPSL
ncbi:uncharacterized protein LOC135642906 [Musa acuminata AAA Group]|uniref:uncharacterized protein LOC135642906 n=1 Tax=Musa acuminata AAA Group TaxID=214697 RepID=UPI0031CEB7C1